MTVFSSYSTPLEGLAGGSLIGLSAGALLLLTGDIMGASGLCSSVILEPIQAVKSPQQAWKLALLTSFMLTSNVILGSHFTDDVRLSEDEHLPIVSWAGYVLGGLFVGFGTKLGNGCTTGHGICGMARLSLRSFVAVCTFMMTALAAAAIIAPTNKSFSSGTKWLRTAEAPEFFNRWLGFAIVCGFFVLPMLVAVINLVRYRPTSSDTEPKQIIAEDEASEKNKLKRQGSSTALEPTEFLKSRDFEDVDVEKGTMDNTEKDGSSNDGSDGKEETPKDNECGCKELEVSAEDEYRTSVRKLLPALFVGALFATGLAVSGMVKPSKIHGFLILQLFVKKSYDPTLLFVMMGGCLVSFVSYQFVEKHNLFNHSYTLRCPLASEKFSVPTNKTIDAQLIGGAFCFGVGWAVAGLCPGPAMFLAATGTKPVLAFWWPAFFVGSFGANKLKQQFSS